MTHAPAVSLVICTRNRADQLSETLSQVAMIRAESPWEVVIVDNGSGDDTPQVIERFRENIPVPVRPVREPKAGLSNARNAGCRTAKGRIIAFTDDDCYPRPDYVSAILEVFAERPDLGYAGGRVLLHDPTDAPVTIREDSEPQLFPPHVFLRAGIVHGANMAFRREVFACVGAFDPCLGAGTSVGSGEDIEMCARASDAGWSGGYFPGPTVRHHHRRKPGSDIDRLMKRYDSGRGAYFAKSLLQLDTLRRECLKHWYRRARGGTLGRTSREVAGAVRYLLCRCVTRPSGDR